MAHKLAAPSNKLPETGFLKIQQILGDRKRDIAPLIPVGKTTWYGGIKSGIYPAPVRLGGENSRSVAWRVEDIRELIKRLRTQNGGES